MNNRKIAIFLIVSLVFALVSESANAADNQYVSKAKEVVNSLGRTLNNVKNTVQRKF